MDKQAIIVIAEHDEKDYSLIDQTLKRAGIHNRMVRLSTEKEVSEFFLYERKKEGFKHNHEYLLILDIGLPDFDSIKFLEEIKQREELKKIPVIIIAAKDDMNMIDACHGLGCSIYIVKPLDHDNFIDAFRKVGMFLSVVELP